MEQSHVDSLSLLDYKRNASCFLANIDASESTMHIIPRRYESFFDSDEISSLTAVYDVLYPGVKIRMFHERFLELKVFNETFISLKSKGSHSSAICAYWAGIRGNISLSNDYLRVGVVQYFFRHTISIPTSTTQTKHVAHIFARIHWYRRHWKESWFHHRALVVQPDMDISGPATFLPISRVFSRCALISKTVQFDYGEDKVVIAILCESGYCI